MLEHQNPLSHKLSPEDEARNEAFRNLDYEQEEFRRMLLLSEIRQSPLNLEVAKLHYRDNPIDFINDFMWTFNPQAKSSKMPFVLFPKQEELIGFLNGCFIDRENGVIPKCREVGLSWVAIAYAVHLWLFFPGKQIGFGSLKAAAVDTLNDIDSLLEKVRFILRNLPPEFMPEGFNMEKHALRMHIHNPVNGSMIKGDSGENIGRSGRASIYFIDEAAHLGNAKGIDAALAGTTECIVYISTIHGIGNMFYQKMQSESVRKFIFPWYFDPRKTPEWLEKKRRSMDPEIFAQEIMIDAAASLSGTCIPKVWLDACINANIPYSGQIQAGVDYADEGKDKHALAIRHGIKLLSTESRFEGTTTEWTRYVWATGKAQNVEVIKYDSIGVGAGGRGEFKSIQEKQDQEEKYKPTIIGVSTGSPPTKGFYADGKKNSDMFLNLRAQLWWNIRDRARKTYEYCVNGEEYDFEEMLILPDNQSLIEELAGPLVKYNENGKIQIESKKEMRKRGLKSPNEADAMVLCYAPINAREIKLITIG